MAADESGTLASLKAHRTEVMEPKTAEYGGRVVKLMGDGTLMEFGSVVDAVNFALDVQRARLPRATRTCQKDQRTEFRIGINIGDVLVEGDDIYGDGVNVAARLEGLAEPGGICISGTVYEHTHNKIDVTFEDLGEQEVKNIAEPLRVYRILTDVRRHARPLRSTRPAPPRLEQAWGSIAVFPFDSLSPDPDDAYLAEGIASEIINMLFRDFRFARRLPLGHFRLERSRRRCLEARARSAVSLCAHRQAYAGPATVLRVIAELTEVANRTQLWSNTYERRLADLFAVQEEIAEAIVVAFGGEYLRAEWRRARTRPTENLDAWGLVQKARSH